MDNYGATTRKPYITRDDIEKTFTNEDSSYNHLKNAKETYEQQKLILDTVSEEEIESQKQAVREAISNAWSKLWEQKRARLEGAMKSRTQITLKSIMDEVSPRALALSNGKGGDMAVAIARKIDDFVYYLLDIDKTVDPEDTWMGAKKKELEDRKNNGEDISNASINWLEAGSTVFTSFGNIGSQLMEDIASDPAVMESISQLNSIKQLAVHINYITTAIADIQEILKFLEPLKPLANILIDYAMSPVTGGASAQRATDTLLERTEFICQQLLCESVEKLRDFIFNIKISVPTLLVESVKTLSISEEFDEEREEIVDWIKSFGTSGSENASDDKIKSFLNTVINGDPLKEPDWSKVDPNYDPENTSDKLYMPDRQYTPDYIGGFFKDVGSASSTMFGSIGKVITDNNLDKPNVFSTIIKGSMNAFLAPAVDQARKNASIPALEDPIWSENYTQYYDASIFENDLDKSLTSLDDALLRNTIPSEYFDENTIRLLSNKILME